MANFYLDIIAIVVVFLAGIVGVWRGFFGSLVSLVGFVGTFILSYFLAQYTLSMLDSICNFTAFFQSFGGSVAGRAFASIIAFILTFLLIRLIIFILNHTVGLLFRGRKVGGMNKFMGGVFGVVKGFAYVAIIMVAVNLASLVPAVNQWTTTAFSQTYFIGEVYNWVGAKLNVYIGSAEQPQSQQQ